MPDRPPVTWLLSIRNSMPFLPATLESIAAQTYPNHQILAWDDCSTDGTLEELNRSIPSRIPGRIFSGRSLRLGPSLAFLVEQADSELCARIDGDDVNMPDRLQKQVSFMLEHPKVGVLGGQAEFIDENDKPVGGGWGFACDDATLRWRSTWRAQFFHPAVMFRRSFVLDAGNYRDCKVEDVELWMRVARVAEFSNLPEPVIRYRRSSTSMTGRTVDFKALDRVAAKANADVLFPGYVGANAMALWEASYPDNSEAQMHFGYFKALQNAAIHMARQTGKPDNYFLNTSSYREQRYHLRRRFLESLGLGFLTRLRQRF